VDKLNLPSVGPQIKEEKLGVAWCVNCVGFHPDKIPGLKEFALKVTAPQQDAWMQLSKMKDWEVRKYYVNKSCMLCGRSYDASGELDITWKITAKRVHEELQRAGIFGVDEKKIELIVARCRKSVEFLFKNRFEINPTKWDRFTFAGNLALIITHAQEARISKNQGLTPENIKGTMKPGKLN